MSGVASPVIVIHNEKEKNHMEERQYDIEKLTTCNDFLSQPSAPSASTLAQPCCLPVLEIYKEKALPAASSFFLFRLFAFFRKKIAGSHLVNLKQYRED
jgi:hypothetical protein